MERIQRKMKHISLERLWNKGRKIGIILFVLVMLVSVTACGRTETARESTAESQETNPVTIPASESMESVNEVSEATTESDVDEKENVQGKEPEQEVETLFSIPVIRSLFSTEAIHGAIQGWDISRIRIMRE